MNSKILIYLFIIIYVCLSDVKYYAQSDRIEAGIDEKLGAYLPLDLSFINSQGDSVLLKDLVNKPILLALVYYECPGICNPLLTELAWVANKVDLVPKEDFEIIALSFDHEETPEIAAKWKHSYFEGMKGDYPEDAWTFLTGDSVSIKTITDVVGFYFRPDDEEFVHAGVVLSISPEGKICRYLFGIKFNPFDVKMALIEAKAGKTNPTISKMLQFCFSYDPEGRTYVLNITRIFGIIILVSIGLVVGFLSLRRSKVKKKKGVLING